VTGSTSFTSDQPVPSTYVFVAVYQVTQPIDPCKCLVQLRHTVSVNADGSVASASVEQEFDS
jgi:hypothetical protein